MDDGKTNVVMAPRQTDESWLTLVQTNSTEGLEAKSAMLGRWLPVTNAVPGSLFVVAGDILETATQVTVRASSSEKHLSQQKFFYKSTSYRIRRIPHTDMHDHRRITLMNMPFTYSRVGAGRDIRAESFLLDDVVLDEKEVGTA